MDAKKEDTIYCTWRALIDTDFCKILYRFVRKRVTADESWTRH